ncbi:uncharacterized protein LOC136080343 [Hydra vulgaris]|uniref:Uncharacterized protein LOC136080343 n=1 Tax=Hydra vulgaris TaxID=6087 RepID=A0ABM4BV20_HYDVU
MAGDNSGVQKRILDLNSLAMFVPCNNHSLSLVGVHATHMGIFEGICEITVKSHSDTRWSSKAAAVTAISTQLEEVLAALEMLRDASGETFDSRGDAELILSAIRRFEFVALLYFWSEILPSINRIQKRAKLQEKMDFSPIGLLTYTSSLGLESYKTLATALQIFITLPISVASCDRSFIKLKLIKSYLRSTMS